MFKDEQHLWNILFTLVFFGLVGSAYMWLLACEKVPTAIPLFHVVLIVFAVFRLTRLFINDVITQWIRDLFLDVRTTELGELVREKPARGPRRTLAILLACPWCLSLWMACTVSFVYVATPHAWLFIFILAIAGIASLLQILGNLMGWSAELQKQKSESFPK